MKAMSPVRSVRSCLGAVCCLSEQSLGIARGAGSGSGAGSQGKGPCASSSPTGGAEEAAGLLDDMKGCYSRLAELVPGIPRGSQPSQVEILQHVIDYIFDLQVVLQGQAKHHHHHHHHHNHQHQDSEPADCRAAELASELCSQDEGTPCH